jgi:hypothetical protein
MREGGEPLQPELRFFGNMVPESGFSALVHQPGRK